LEVVEMNVHLAGESALLQEKLSRYENRVLQAEIMAAAAAQGSSGQEGYVEELEEELSAARIELEEGRITLELEREALEDDRDAMAAASEAVAEELELETAREIRSAREAEAEARAEANMVLSALEECGGREKEVNRLQDSLSEAAEEKKALLSELSLRGRVAARLSAQLASLKRPDEALAEAAKREAELTRERDEALEKCRLMELELQNARHSKQASSAFQEMVSGPFLGAGRQAHAA